jgi:hypothetical protein
MNGTSFDFSGPPRAGAPGSLSDYFYPILKSIHGSSADDVWAVGDNFSLLRW